METPLLQTKFHIPHWRQKLVSRPRLIEKLTKGIDRKMTLVCAPAGFGKTTLIGEWSRQSDRRVAWLTLDEADDEAYRFVAYLVTCLRTVEPDFGKGVLAALQSPQPLEMPSILAIVSNELANVSRPVTLVLDDYYRIQAPDVHKILEHLLSHLPLKLHLVMCTRVDPPLPLTRYRVQGELVEIREQDLRFTPEEVTVYFNDSMALDLSAEEIAILAERTEGWIASLWLVALSLRDHPDRRAFLRDFSGSHHFVIDYLMDEVLLKQPERIRTFLCQASILDRFCGSLCDVVMQISTSRQILRDLERENLFLIPLDDDRRWYRFHHLFAEFLRQQLLDEDLERVAALHQRASYWFEQNGSVDDAINHAIAAMDYDRAAGLAEELAAASWRSGRPTSISNWVETMPDAHIACRPTLCIHHAWELNVKGNQEAAANRLQQVEQAVAQQELSCETPDSLRDHTKSEVGARTAAIRAAIAMYQGAYDEAIRYATLADRSLSTDDHTWRIIAKLASGGAYEMCGEMNAAHRSFQCALDISRDAGHPYLIFRTALHVASVLLFQGRLNAAAESCRDVVELARETGLHRMELTGCAYDQWGLAEFEQNHVDLARQLMAAGREIALQGSDICVLGWSYLCRIRTLISLGDSTGARSEIHAVEKLALASDVPPWITTPVACWKARMWLQEGNVDAAAQWTLERGLRPDEERPSFREGEYTVLARVLIAQRRLDEALRLLYALLPATEAGDRTPNTIEILLLIANAHMEQGERDLALNSVKRAGDLASRGGHVRIFLDEGPPIERLLRLATKTAGFEQDYLTTLNRAFELERRRSQHSGRQPLLEPLSKRELEVLRLIDRGLTNQQIAAELIVSINTVKAHAKHIYGKLDVHGRLEAAQRARDLELL